MDKTKVFVDLDDTIFDMKSLKHGLLQIFMKNCPNVPTETLMERYVNYRDNHGSLSEFAEEFAEDGDVRAIKGQLSDLASSYRNYLIQERLDFVLHKYADREHYRLILFTKGLRLVQEAKVKACGLEQYFDEIIYVQGEKPEALKEVIESGEPFVLIDDRGPLLEAIGADHGAGELWQFDEDDSARIYIADQDPSLRELPPQR